MGNEALLRRADASRGAVAPTDLLATHDASVLERIDLFVLERALEQAAAARREDPASRWRIHVNLSPALLEYDTYVRAAERLLASHRELASSVVFELTERQPMNPDRVLPRMMRLRQQGARFALDDFGTGYANLHCLARLPFQIVKLDRSLVADLTARPRSATLLEEVLQMAGALNLELIAEGIETRRQRVTLLILGCALGQGFLLGRPRPGLPARDRAA